MIGDKAYQNAMTRRAELRQELEQIDTFLRLCEKFAELPSRSESAVPQRAESESDIVAIDADTGARTEVELKTVAGVDLLPYARRMALDLGRPVSRGDVKQRLAEYGVRLNAKDQATYIGTLLWRAKDQFVNLKPYGYWPKDVAYAPAGYDPAARDETEEEEHVDEQCESDTPASQERLWELAAKGASGGK